MSVCGGAGLGGRTSGAAASVCVPHTGRSLQSPSKAQQSCRFFGAEIGDGLGLGLALSCSKGRPKWICTRAHACDAPLQRRSVRTRVRCGAGERGPGGIGFTEVVDEDEEIPVARRTVAVFWDLDNKPPKNVPPYDAALRLKGLAAEFGEVLDVVAYANRNAFSYVPSSVREERQDRRMLDELERRGVVKVEHPYVCRLCGKKSRTNLDLKKHFKQLHERERNKRMAYLGQLKGRKRGKYIEKMASKENKYKEAARTLIVPKVGYGLASELKRAGVAVRTVEKKPQAADVALLRHMNLYISKGIECICLVSDDSDFLGVLRLARAKRIFTIVVGDTATLRGAAEASFSWAEVASGRAMLTAQERSQRWAIEDQLKAELSSDYKPWDEANEGEANEGGMFSRSGEGDSPMFQTDTTSSMEPSAFAEDEEGYTSNDEDGYVSDDEDWVEQAEEDDRYGGWERETA